MFTTIIHVKHIALRLFTRFCCGSARSRSQRQRRAIATETPRETEGGRERTGARERRPAGQITRYAHNAVYAPPAPYGFTDKEEMLIGT